MIVLYIFNLFSMLNLDFRLVSQCICLRDFCIFSTIDLVCSFHVSYVSKWSPVICVPFRRMFGGILSRNVNVIWLHLLEFAYICFSCSHFSIFVICSCSIGPKTLPCSIPVLMSLTSECASLIFITKVLLLR